MSGKTASLLNETFYEVSLTLERFFNDSIQKNTLEHVVAICIEAYKKKNKILIAGNGGSAADAQHFAGELVSRFYFDRPALAAIALTTDTSILTAIGNDYGYLSIFSRQIEAHGVEGDIFFAISTSGNSDNILNAIKVAKQKNLIVVGLTGELGGKMKALCDYCLCIPSQSTPRIQECHLVIEHSICACIESELFKDAI